jgi:hypothetical protein
VWQGAAAKPPPTLTAAVPADLFGELAAEHLIPEAADRP